MKLALHAMGVGLLLIAMNARSDDTTIAIQSFQFVPQEITVKVGATITWINHDETVHAIADQDKAFRSGGLDTNDRYSFTFSKPGTYVYYCTLHPQMTGTIQVQ